VLIDNQPEIQGQKNLPHKKSLLEFPPAVLFGAIIFPLIFTIINLSWYPRSPEGWVHSGFLQNDQYTYTAYARSVFERGNGITYANPYDCLSDSPRILSNFGYLLLGWLKALLPFSWVNIWELLRLVGGIAMALLLYKLLCLFIEEERRRLFFWFLAMSGGGIAWLVALPKTSAMSWLQAFIYVEGGSGRYESYGFWALNIFRQGLYPLETLYHSLLYGIFIAYLLRRTTFALGLLFLLWWAHPITASLASTTLIAASIIEWLFKSNRRFHSVILLGTIVITCMFAVYNFIFLTSFPASKSLVEQTLSFGHKLLWTHILLAWGFLLIAIPLVFVTRTSRCFLFSNNRGRFILIWFITVFLWTHNDWFLPRMIQPIHFARGHFLLALILLLATSTRGLSGAILQKRFSKLALNIILGSILTVGVMDNLFFVCQLATRTPYPGLLTVSVPMTDILDNLNNLEQSQVILSLNREIGIMVPARTHHRVVIGDYALTPFLEEKGQELKDLFDKGDPKLLNRYKVKYLVAEEKQIRTGVLDDGLIHFQRIYTNGYYALYERKLSEGN